MRKQVVVASCVYLIGSAVCLGTDTNRQSIQATLDAHFLPFHPTRSRPVELMRDHCSGTQDARALRRSANVVTAAMPTNISNQVCGSGTVITVKSM